MTANYPPTPVVWSRPRAGSIWHARRSPIDETALCRYTPKTGWVGVREDEPAAGRYPAGKGCTVCLLRARALVAAR